MRSTEKRGSFMSSSASNPGSISIAVRAHRSLDPSAPAVEWGAGRGTPLPPQIQLSGFALAQKVLEGLSSGVILAGRINIIKVRFIEGPTGTSCMVMVAIQVSKDEELLVPEELATILPYEFAAHEACIERGALHVLKQVRATLERKYLQETRAVTEVVRLIEGMPAETQAS